MITSFRNVEYEGNKYNIEFRDFAAHSHEASVNGEKSSALINNAGILDIDILKNVIILAIKEYIERHAAQQAIKEWDGKL